MSDCEELQASSKYILHWIKKQPDVKEESLTDWLLFNVSEKIPAITYRSFSRHDEAHKTGADWEWWFLFPSFCFVMRIQAKKLHPSDDNYLGIAHTNRYGLQIEKLLRDASKCNFMPFYAFYTAENANVMCRMKRNDEGVLLAGANKIYDEIITPPRKLITPNDVLKFTVALSCLLCCPLASGIESLRETGSGGEYGDGWKEFMENYYESEIHPKFENDEAEFSNREQMPGIHEKVPEYIQSFVKLSAEGLPDWWEKKFHYSIEGTNALMVYDLREGPQKK